MGVPNTLDDSKRNNRAERALSRDPCSAHGYPSFGRRQGNERRVRLRSSQAPIEDGFPHIMTRDTLPYMKRKASTPKKRPTKAKPPAPKSVSADSVIGDLHRLIEGKVFGSAADLTAFLAQSLVGGRVPEVRPRTPLEQAQELANAALHARTIEETFRLATQALTLSWDCADAHALLADFAPTPQQKLRVLGEAVAAGERALPKAIFKQAGHFWSILETRPYMRARAAYAKTCWDMSRRKEAATHYTELLRLCTNDNLGIRYLLVTLLLELGENGPAATLMAEYDEDSTFFAWSHALLAIREASATAPRAVAAARKANPHVSGYLTGMRALPKHLPEVYSWGDENEAVIYATEARTAWTTTPGAIDALKDTEPKKSTTRAKQKKK